MQRLSIMFAVAGLSFATLDKRLGMTAAATIAVALAVGVLVAFLAMAYGFQSTLKGSGADDVGVITRSGAVSEVTSSVSLTQLRQLAMAPGLRRSSGGEPLISAETLVVLDGRKRVGGTAAGLALRGIGADGIALRPTVTLVRGRMFGVGTNELVVGAGVAREFTGFEIGDRIRLGGTGWQVVGIAAAPGTVFESELWADNAVVRARFRSDSAAQIVRVGLETPSSINYLKSFLAEKPQVAGLSAQSERSFFAAQSQQFGTLLRYIGWPLGITMALGALTGALNALYSSVAARQPEIATLRTLGFPRSAIFTGIMAESIAICLAGGILGLVACTLLFHGVSTTAIGAGFAQIVFQMRIDAATVQQALLVALVIGILGGLLPALGGIRQKPLIGLGAG